MTMQTADRLRVLAAWLDTLPLPEPSVHTYPELRPGVTWTVDVEWALTILAAVGGEWTVHTYDDPQTIATRVVDHMGTRIYVTVNVEGVNLPDLATDAAGLGVGSA